MSYTEKYLKYKNKYLTLKSKYGHLLTNKNKTNVNNITGLLSNLQMSESDVQFNNNVKIVDLAGGAKKRRGDPETERTEKTEKTETETTITIMSNKQNNTQLGGRLRSLVSDEKINVHVSKKGTLEVGSKKKSKKAGKNKKSSYRQHFFDDSDFDESSNTLSQVNSDSTLSSTATDEEL
jgi:hypothetical protein